MPIDPPEPIHDSTFVSSRPSGLAWNAAGASDPSGVALGVLKDRSGNTYHVGPDNSGSGGVVWLMSSSVNTGGGGLLMSETDGNRVINATSVNASGQLVSGGVAFAGQQTQYMSTGSTPHTTLTVYRLV